MSDDQKKTEPDPSAAAFANGIGGMFAELFEMARDAPEDDKPLLAGIPFAEHLGLRLVGGGEGYAELMAPYDERMIGDADSGVLHGGVVTTLLDNCAGMAAGASSSRTSAVATLDLRIDYLRPATPGLPIYAEAKIYRQTSQIDFVRAIAHQGDRGEPVATAVATFMSETRVKSIIGDMPPPATIAQKPEGAE